MSAYSWGVGHDVAALDLETVEDDLAAYLDGIPFAISAPPVNPFPVRTVLASGRERGDGRVDVTWTIPRLSRSAMNYIEDTYLSSGAAASAAVTILTRLHDQDTWARYNAYLCLPVPDADYTYALGEFVDVKLRFRNLTTPA